MRKRSSSVEKEQNSKNSEHPEFVPRMEASRVSSALAYRGEQGERRKLGLSVGSGLHSCTCTIVIVCPYCFIAFDVGDELYRERRDKKIESKMRAELEECTFNPVLPGKETHLQMHLKRNKSII